jgi:molybdopterin converting factor small subunit
VAALPSPMIAVHVYGRLRRVADDRRATSDSVVGVRHEPGDTVRAVAERLGFHEDELGTNLCRNGRYASLDTPVEDGDRLGLFPSDMQLLYKWYFDPNAGAEHES